MTYLAADLADGVKVKRERTAAGLFGISRTRRGARAFGFAQDEVETIFAAATLVAAHEAHEDGILAGAGLKARLWTRIWFVFTRIIY